MADLVRLFNFIAGDPIRSSEVDAEFDQLIARINNIDADSLQSALAEALGVSQAGIKRRGKSIVATEEARTSTSYGLLATPDAVDDIVLPGGGGLIIVAFHGLWKESAVNAARASIFLNGNALTTNALHAAGQTTAWSEAQTYAGGFNTNIYTALSSHASGLKSFANDAGVNHATNVTTGQAVHTSSKYNDTFNLAAGGGGLCAIFADAGTYDVSIQWKATSGTVTAKERKLWVWTEGFG